MGARRKGRELAMQMLFQSDIGKQTRTEVLRVFWDARKNEDGEQTVDAESQAFAEDLFRVATERSEEVDGLIEGHADNWRLHRMAGVDRNLLRMAVAELVAFPATPYPIVIDEALEIGRRYAAPESIRFLNGVLDAVAKDVLAKRLA